MFGNLYNLPLPFCIANNLSIIILALKCILFLFNSYFTAYFMIHYGWDHFTRKTEHFFNSLFWALYFHVKHPWGKVHKENIAIFTL